jgi:diacylglycerol O-acyltransferase
VHPDLAHPRATLDRARPLWEIYVIEGLDNVEGYPPGSFACSARCITRRSTAPRAWRSPRPSTTWSACRRRTRTADWRDAEPRPSALKLLARAQINTLRQPLRFISVARNTVPGLAKAYLPCAGRFERIGKVPRTRFNGSVSSYRVFTAISVSLD